MKWREKILIQTGVHSDFGGMCNRSGKCVEVPVYHRAVWRRGICADLSVLPGYSGASDYGDGVCSRPCEPEERGAVV